MSSGVVCPYCGTDPERIPQRRFLCKGCSNRVVVRTIDGHQLPLLLKELDARRFDLVSRYLGYDEPKAVQLVELAGLLKIAVDPDAVVMDWCRRHDRFQELVFYAERQSLDVAGAKRERFRHELKRLRDVHRVDPGMGVVIGGQYTACCDHCSQFTKQWRSFDQAIAESRLPIPGCTRLNYYNHVECCCRYVAVHRDRVESAYPFSGTYTADVPAEIREPWQRSVAPGEIEDAEVELVGGPLDGTTLTIDQAPPSTEGGVYYWSGPGTLKWASTV